MARIANLRLFQAGAASIGVIVALFAANLLAAAPGMAATHAKVGDPLAAVAHLAATDAKTADLLAPAPRAAARHAKAACAKHRRPKGRPRDTSNQKHRRAVAKKRAAACAMSKQKSAGKKPAKKKPSKPKKPPAKSASPATNGSPAARNSTFPTVPASTLTNAGDPLTTIGLPSAAATDPSGASMPTGNLPGWTQVYSDDFTTPVPLGGFTGCHWGGTYMGACSGAPASVSAQMFAYPDGGTSGNGTYEPSQVLSIHDGMLDYDLHTSAGAHMVSAVVPKIPAGPEGEGLQYGAYAIRFKADSNPGYSSAFLLWPDSNTWPQDGEIDFPEGDLDGTVWANMHEMNTNNQVDKFSTKTTFSAWHTFVIEWTPNACKFIIDGQVIGTSVPLIPSDPMHWVLQAGTTLAANSGDSVTDHIYVDWIAAYAQAS